MLRKTKYLDTIYVFKVVLVPRSSVLYITTFVGLQLRIHFQVLYQCGMDQRTYEDAFSWYLLFFAKCQGLTFDAIICYQLITHPEFFFVLFLLI